jgi:hypothetical protein
MFCPKCGGLSLNHKKEVCEKLVSERKLRAEKGPDKELEPKNSPYTIYELLKEPRVKRERDPVRFKPMRYELREGMLITSPQTMFGFNFDIYRGCFVFDNAFRVGNFRGLEVLENSTVVQGRYTRDDGAFFNGRHSTPLSKGYFDFRAAKLDSKVNVRIKESDETNVSLLYILSQKEQKEIGLQYTDEIVQAACGLKNLVLRKRGMPMDDTEKLLEIVFKELGYLQ